MLQSKERDRKGESEWEGEQTRINEGYATGTGLDRTVRYAHEIQYLFFEFFLRGMLHCMRCLSPSLSLFFFSFFFGSCYYWCCLVSLFSFCLLWFLLLLLLQGFSAVLFKYLLTCTERNIWRKLKNYFVCVDIHRSDLGKTLYFSNIQNKFDYEQYIEVKFWFFLWHKTLSALSV